MIDLIRTDSDNNDFKALVKELDIDLKIRDGDEHSFFAQFNKIDAIKHVVIAYIENTAVGCGTIKKYDETTIEIKRMFVPIAYRGKGIASLVLKELENWSSELHFKKCILETGKKQPEAIQLYKKNNYTIIPNYGQYKNVASSICFQKLLNNTI